MTQEVIALEIGKAYTVPKDGQLIAKVTTVPYYENGFVQITSINKLNREEEIAAIETYSKQHIKTNTVKIPVSKGERLKINLVDCLDLGVRLYYKPA